MLIVHSSRLEMDIDYVCSNFSSGLKMEDVWSFETLKLLCSQPIGQHFTNACSDYDHVYSTIKPVTLYLINSLTPLKMRTSLKRGLRTCLRELHHLSNRVTFNAALEFMEHLFCVDALFMASLLACLPVYFINIWPLKTWTSLHLITKFQSIVCGTNRGG
jgi:hypothetical protein